MEPRWPGHQWRVEEHLRNALLGLWLRPPAAAAAEVDTDLAAGRVRRTRPLLVLCGLALSDFDFYSPSLRRLGLGIFVYLQLFLDFWITPPVFSIYFYH